MPTYIWTFSSGSFCTALRSHEIHTQIALQKENRRVCAICYGGNFLEITVGYYVYPSQHWAESQYEVNPSAKICHWLFNIWLPSGVVFPLTNLLLKVKSVPMMKLLLNGQKCCWLSYLSHWTSSLLLRFSSLYSWFNSRFNIRPSFSKVLFWDAAQKCHAAVPE